MKLVCAFLFLMLSVSSKSQVIADPATGQMDITDQSGNSLNANFIAPDNLFSLKIPLYNLNQLVPLPAGTCKFIITLGNRMILDPTFNLATAPLNNYISWTSAITGGKVQITGNLINTLPADFVAIMEFKLKATASTGSSIIESDFLVTNDNATTLLTDEDLNNNNATLSYTVTRQTLPVTFSNVSLLKKGCRVQVNFTAENAINVNRYEIELSKNGIHFFKIGMCQPSSRAAFNFNFNLVDSLTAAPNIFVRIKSVDNDGSYTYSNTRQMNGICEESKEGDLFLYPNPLNYKADEVVIATKGSLLNGNYHLTLIDMGGKNLKNFRVNLMNVSRFNYHTGNLSSGQYILRVTNNTGLQIANIHFYKL